MKKKCIILNVLAFVFLFCFESYSQNGKVVFLELKTIEPNKGSKEDASQIIEYVVPTGKNLKIESAIASPIPTNTSVCFLYLNDKLLSHYSFLRPPPYVLAPLPIYLPSGKYQFKLSGNICNAFVSGLEY